MGRVSVNITTFPISTLKTNRHDAGLYSGDNCGKLFSKSADLKLNVDPIHDGIRYFCNQCDYEATQTSHLRTHTKSIHEKITYARLQFKYFAYFNSD